LKLRSSPHAVPQREPEGEIPLQRSKKVSVKILDADSQPEGAQ
jgi:hypothetical protein